MQLDEEDVDNQEKNWDWFNKYLGTMQEDKNAKF
jgi:hypothetical protein